MPPQAAPLTPPTTDDLPLLEALGAKGYHDDTALVQYAAWAATTGLFTALADGEARTEEELVAATGLTPAGVDALTGVLVTLGVIHRSHAGLALSPEGCEYLVPASPYFMGDSLFVACSAPVPAAYQVADPRSFPTRLRSALAFRLDGLSARIRGHQHPGSRAWALGGEERLLNQHSRNLPGGVAAANLDLFAHATCVVDVGGGTGTFAIPLAQRLPDARVVLTDLPDAVEGVRTFLDAHAHTGHIEVVAMDLFAPSWPIPVADAIFFGNVMHIFDDATVATAVARSAEYLRPGGAIVLHELVWNEDRTGPLKTALFNATMRTHGGRQRTVAELHAILEAAGYVDPFSHDTAGGFAAVGGRTPAT